MKVKFSDQYGNDVTYNVPESELGYAFERMLPMTVKMTKTGSREFSFVPPKKMNCFGAQLAPGGIEGLCYHQPWNEIILYYGGYSEYEDLYELGTPICGMGAVRNLKGDVIVEKVA
ncbi:cyclophilin-like fold protein [Erysipelotrichaceae bacterium 51-3]|uniref:cyclophilin-like fold protein n=1 Tax=Allobaculum sp. JKK-2023 TaxID=3108943 RepID=UPI002B058DC0|nr:cyclophilin-like fold protein [Allobaculum sp. JKK-2023]